MSYFPLVPLWISSSEILEASNGAIEEILKIKWRSRKTNADTSILVDVPR